MTREQIEHAIKCCNPYEENCGDCPFKDLPLGRCFEVLAKTAFNMLLDDRERLQKQVDEYKAKIEQGTLIELPCPIGTMVYYIASYEKKIGLFGKRKDCYTIMEFPFELEMLDSYGNNWFLPREEAEARLKELRVVKNENNKI